MSSNKHITSQYNTKARNRVIKQLARELAKQKQENMAFYHSPLCQRMIDDMMRVGVVFNVDDLAYYPDRVKSTFGWGDLSIEQIRAFVDVMYSNTIGEITNYSEMNYDDCPFYNYKFIKRDILVSVLVGQGTAITMVANR